MNKKFRYSFVLLCCSFLFSCVIPAKSIMLYDPQKDIGEWTLIVYMAADNDLEEYAIQDINEMEAAVSENTNIIVLFDRAKDYDETNDNWTGTRMYRVLHDNDGNNTNIVSERLACPVLGIKKNEDVELNMANPDILDRFIHFAKENYKANKYAFVMWGHGAGYKGYAFDDFSDDLMDVGAIRSVLEKSRFDLLIFDTCYGATIETISEIKECADFFVGNPFISNRHGLNYEKALPNFADNRLSMIEIGKKVANCGEDYVCVDLSKMDDLLQEFETLCCTLASRIIDKTSQENIFTELKQLCVLGEEYPCDGYISMENIAAKYGTNSFTNSLSKCCISSKKNISVLFGAFSGRSTLKTPVHENSYVTGIVNRQCAFVKNGWSWCPSEDGNSGSLLDKLFYVSME